jgi:hypothetical protein
MKEEGLFVVSEGTRLNVGEGSLPDAAPCAEVSMLGTLAGDDKRRCPWVNERSRGSLKLWM